MSKTLAEVTRDALKLPEDEKFKLAGYLLECVATCRQREARHPENTKDITLESFLRDNQLD